MHEGKAQSAVARMSAFWLAGAGLLAIGALHYLAARSVPDLAAWPASLPAPSPWIHLPAFVNGALPSFLHTLAFGFLGAAAQGGRKALVPAAAVAGAVNLLFELGQHPAMAARLSLGYFVNGTFDAMDVLAVACAVVLAAFVSLWLDRRTFP